MTKIAHSSPSSGSGSITLRAPITETNVDLELPLTGTHLASAQADGMPLGPGGDPVMESGSNSDGEWVRWADGTQWARSIRTGFSWASGSSDSRQWTFPVAFINTTGLVCVASIQSVNPELFNAASGSVTEMGVPIAVGGSNSGSGSASAIATGRWK